VAGTAWVADADVLAPVVDMDEAIYGVQAKSRCYDYRVFVTGSQGLGEATPSP
jgi:hypothetical protein